MPTKENISALAGGIRPYESLWSIVHRFLWLNRPSSTEIKRCFSSDGGFSLLLSSEGLNNTSVTRQKHVAQLYSLLAITKTQFRKSLLPSFLSPSGFRYCPECAKLGYHSLVFSIPHLDYCPAHHVPLVCHCLSCHRNIGDSLDIRAIEHPYSCPHCFRSLVVSRAMFFETREPPNFDRIRKVGAWMNHLSAQSVAWGALSCSMFTQQSFSAAQ